jgi:hypothetical protein
MPVRFRSPARGLFPVVLAAAGVLLFRNLSRISDFLTFRLLGLRPGNRFSGALRFFVYEVPKVLLLLV